MREAAGFSSGFACARSPARRLLKNRAPAAGDRCGARRLSGQRAPLEEHRQADEVPPWGERTKLTSSMSATMSGRPRPRLPRGSRQGTGAEAAGVGDDEG